MPDLRRPIAFMLHCSFCGNASMAKMIYLRDSQSVTDAYVARIVLDDGWRFDIDRALVRCPRHAD